MHSHALPPVSSPTQIQSLPAIPELTVAGVGRRTGRVKRDAEKEFSFKKYHSVYLHQHVLLRVPPPLNIPIVIYHFFCSRKRSTHAAHAPHSLHILHHSPAHHIHHAPCQQMNLFLLFRMFLFWSTVFNSLTAVAILAQT